MQRRYNLTRLILASIVVLGLTLLTVDVDAQARIAFSSNRDGHVHVIHRWPAPEIYVMDADGKNQRRLTNNIWEDRSPSWSPDGERIVFSSGRDGNREIYVMDADGGNQLNLTNNPQGDYSPSWSPDGKRIVFSSDREIYVMDADGSNQQNLTNNPDSHDVSPSWSPDGKRIVFSSYRTEHFRGEFGITYEIYVMDANGQNQQNLTNNRGNDGSPSWSPDGKRIAFSSYRDGHFQSAEIYVMDADGSNQRRLTNNGHADYSPSWSPDGERIAFSSCRDGNWEIYVMGVNGGNQRRLTKHGSHNLAPTWYTPAFAVAPAD